MLCRRLGVLRSAAFAALIWIASSPLAAESGPPVFKLYVAAAGPYKVSFEQLARAGLASDALPSAELGLTHRGHPVPVWVEDGGDGVFGPGDWIEFLGELVHGWVSYNDEHTRYNVYFLRFDVTDPLRMVDHRPVTSPDFEGEVHKLRRRRHHERDLQLFRQPPPLRGERPDELWYWAKLTHEDREPFTYPLAIGDLAVDDGRSVEIRIELSGWSEPAHKPDPRLKDHRVEVRLNGREVASAEWNGRRPHLVVVPAVPASELVTGTNTLELVIPKRPLGEGDRTLIDVVMLNWIEVNYPRIEEIGGAGTDFELSAPLERKPVRVLSPPGEEYLVYGPRGSRMVLSNAARQPWDERVGASMFEPPPFESSLIVANPDDLKAPEAIVLDRPSSLAETSNRADYIMVVHRRLLEAIEPLAEFHRSRGLDVAVVDLQDIYDEFDHGIAGPWALRAFLEHAYHRWQKPSPRFVLLVGDASWNGKNVYARDGSFADHTAGRPKRRSRRARQDGELLYTPYASGTALKDRNLIPTWDHTSMIRSASDNYFVAVDGDDGLPDMAIGRLPVVEPAEVTQIVDKVIQYASSPEVGPWRRNVVFITNTDRRFQTHSDRQARGFAAMGFSTQKVYPAIKDDGNEGHRERLLGLFDEGQLFVQFLGHGGRFIWRTGRRDVEKGRDLFGLEHLEQLEPTGRLPVVLSLACFSAPFDHPEADSIGEKLLRLDDRGAIAVLGASSRNSPSVTWGQALFDELRRPEATIGEAVMNAKRQIRYSGFVERYNLMGDPAVPVAMPAWEIALSAEVGKKNRFKVRGAVETGDFSGELLVELLDEEGEILRSTELRLDAPEFAVNLETSAEELAAGRILRAYAWDSSLGIDALGVLEVGTNHTNGSEPHASSPPRVQSSPRRPAVKTSPSAPAEEIRADTVAWWSFEEGEGSRVLDRTGTHSAVLVDRALRSSGRRGSALSFGGHGYVDAGNSDSLGLDTGDFTLHAWIKTRQARRQYWVILDKRARAAGYHLYNHWGHLGLQLGDGRFTNYEGPFIADGRWHHVAVTVDRDQSDGIRWFVDGVEAGERQDPTPYQGSLTNPAHLSIGGRRTGGGNFVGSLDEIGILRRALTAGEVAQLYAGGWSWLEGN